MDAKTILAVFLVLFFVISMVLTKFLDWVCSTAYYKQYFVNVIRDMTESGTAPHTPLASIKQAQFAEIYKKLQDVPGDAMEIGAGSGASLDFLRLPEGSSLVVVDYNEHFEKPFREKLAKYPDIHLKDYKVQSAADMSNIPDESFSAVFVTDVLCSVDEESLRKMLKEVKRILKQDGGFYVFEHVLENPGTVKRFLQKFVCWVNWWPRLFDDCHCDRETWRYIEEAGFKNVNLSYVHAPLPEKKHMFDQMTLSILLLFVGYFMHGHATK